jgi:phage shock protein A
MSAAVFDLDPFARSTDSAVVALRREAVRAVARQEQLRRELAGIRTRACEIEEQASRALGLGDGIRARQILARGMLTLQTRDALEAELVLSRGEVARLAEAMVRSENRRWQAGRDASSTSSPAPAARAVLEKTG